MVVPVRGVVLVPTSLEPHFGSVGHEKGLQLVCAEGGVIFKPNGDVMSASLGPLPHPAVNDE